MSQNCNTINNNLMLSKYIAMLLIQESTGR